MHVNVFRLAYPVTALGPGRRVVVWVAGCGKRCPGCISPEMQSPASGRALPVAVLARRLLQLEPSLDGITISGGEPFDQARALEALLETVRAARPGWTVLVYSGYTRAELEARGLAVARLLALTDVLIDGAYQRDIPQAHPLAGSGNQVIHYLTARGIALIPAMDEVSSARFDIGLGDGAMHMIIGVTGETARNTVREAVFPGARILASNTDQEDCEIHQDVPPVRPLE